MDGDELFGTVEPYLARAWVGAAGIARLAASGAEVRGGRNQRSVRTTAAIRGIANARRPWVDWVVSSPASATSRAEPPTVFTTSM
jgi:hypothetical protein